MGIWGYGDMGIWGYGEREGKEVNIVKASILVPLDGSALAETALPHALALAHLTSRSLTLLRVVPMPVAYSQAVWGGAPLPGSVWEGVEEEPERAREYLASTASHCSEGLSQGEGSGSGQGPVQEQLDIEVHTQVLEGDPASAIIKHVEEHPLVTTIAMATHGRRGLDRWISGSVAEKVLHSSPVPLLLVRASEEVVTLPLPAHPLDEVKYNTIVVPLDGSSFAEMALEQAQHLASRSGARLVLISALPENPAISDMLIPREEQSLWDSEFEWRSSYLEEIKARLCSEGLEVDSHIVGTFPAEAILELSEREGADLIVMSTHGRGGLPRLWLGSVASDVVRQASRPVLLIRAKAHEEQHGSEVQEDTPALRT